MAELHANLRMPKWCIKGQVHYGQNSYDLLMISSFAVTSIDPVTDARTYTPLTSLSTWMEIHTTHPVWQVGLFGGYTRNLGASETIDPNYVLGSRGDIDHVWRISPRFLYNIKKFRLSLELEYTTAAFGTITTDGTIQDPESVSNLRSLIGVYYFF